MTVIFNLKINIMKQVALLCIFLCMMQAVICQNVGVGVAEPQHKLDVNGDVNVTGSLRNNGQAGSANQVLMSTGSGTMAWADLTQYTAHETFVTAGAGTWTVPVGVTKIMVEAWGAGGGGSCQGGGGGGGYISAYFTVVPGASVSYTVGNNGVGSNCSTTASNHGELSSVTVNSILVRGLGGLGCYSYSSTGFFLGRGGAFSVSPSSFRNWRGMAGEDGTPNQVNYMNPSSGVYWLQTVCGSGGNGANSSNTGSHGGITLENGITILKYVTGGTAQQPGGGGSGNTPINTSYYGGSGADGMVVINY